MQHIFQKADLIFKQHILVFGVLFLLVSSMGVLGCSGCSESVEDTLEPTQEGIVAPRSSMSHSHYGETLHTHDHAVPEAPKEQVGQKHPSQMTKAEISSLFHEAVADPDFVKAQERMHTIAQKVGAGNSDWTEYLHLLGHGLIESPPASAQMYMNLEDALRFNELHLKLFGEDEKVREQLEKTRLKIKWNNKDGAEMQRQVQPIKDVLSWMKGNAPFEWAVVNQHYDELVQERSFALLPKDFKTDWLTPTERAEIRYEAFFDALELLPDGSVTLQALYKNEITNVQQTLLSKRAIIKAELPPPPKPKHTIPHTVDMVHEMLAPSADPMTQAPGGKNLRSVPNPSTPTAAEKRIAEQFPTQGVAPRDGKRRSSASRKPPDARDK